MKVILSIALFFCGLQLSIAQKILFVGNSLTYTNNVPAMVKTLGKASGKKLQTECICFPNYGLEDHWHERRIQKKIKSGSYDFVVFQQGPSSQAYGRSSLHEFGGKISNFAREYGTTPAYFMVWPSLRYYQTFDGVIKNHRDAAAANNALLIPLGEHWRKLHEAGSTPTLYGPDGFHPSKKGSFLAALTIYKNLFPETDLSTLSYKRFRSYVNEKEFAAFLKLLDD